jgi:hypothetical protein
MRFYWIFAILVANALAHLCIFDPPQRGKMNISDAGDDSCFRHRFPCGGQPPQPPQVHYLGNDFAQVHFQQNYNHYSIGNPGFCPIITNM